MPKSGSIFSSGSPIDRGLTESSMDHAKRLVKEMQHILHCSDDRMERFHKKIAAPLFIKESGSHTLDDDVLANIKQYNRKPFSTAKIYGACRTRRGLCSHEAIKIRAELVRNKIIDVASFRSCGIVWKEVFSEESSCRKALFVNEDGQIVQDRQQTWIDLKALIKVVRAKLRITSFVVPDEELANIINYLDSEKQRKLSIGCLIEFFSAYKPQSRTNGSARTQRRFSLS